MNTQLDFAGALRTVYLEARYLDQQRWDDWLQLFTDDCTFWVPAWRNERDQVQDPQCEVSFLYADGRHTLEERVRRIRSGKSITTLPMPRTAHLLGNPIELDASAPDRLCIGTTWTNHLYDPRTARQIVLFGHYEHELMRVGEHIRIAAKKVSIANDRVPTVLDIYSV